MYDIPPPPEGVKPEDWGMPLDSHRPYKDLLPGMKGRRIPRNAVGYGPVDGIPWWTNRHVALQGAVPAKYKAWEQLNICDLVGAIGTTRIIAPVGWTVGKSSLKDPDNLVWFNDFLLPIRRDYFDYIVMYFGGDIDWARQPDRIVKNKTVHQPVVVLQDFAPVGLVMPVGPAECPGGIEGAIRRLTPPPVALLVQPMSVTL